MKVIRPGNAATKALIDVYDLQGNVEQDLVYLAQVYEEARQVIGITDSFQGRTDSTATSGKAKEFAAAQSAGRLESKRVMKDFTYSQLFEAMFKFKLAYADEPRPVVSSNIRGEPEYKEFNRYDFLERDEAGDWHWIDDFLFSCDTSAPLASNREAMWQETRMNLQTGAFGDPTSLQTLILFWTKMEMLHYPGASETRAYLEEELQRQMMQQRMQAQMQQMQMQAMARQRQTQAAGPGRPAGTAGRRRRRCGRGHRPGGHPAGPAGRGAGRRSQPADRSTGPGRSRLNIDTFHTSRYSLASLRRGRRDWGTRCPPAVHRSITEERGTRTWRIRSAATSAASRTRARRR